MYVKVCGITHIDDARAALDAGADVLGFNLIPSSRRHILPELARSIVAELRGEVICVAVVANLTPSECTTLGARAGIDRFQLHGDEPPEHLEALAPRAYKALRIGDSADVERARVFPGAYVLVDAKVEGQLGGTGQRAPWQLLAPLAAARPILLAGGLTPENVEQAVRLVQPWGVDVASGVEQSGDVRRKDVARLRRFVEAARRASRSKHSLRF
jgi:phosphoribosylanthranilate isomerase